MYLKWPNLRELIWLSPPNVGGENVSSILYRYMNKICGWTHGTENPCIIYAGSESVLEQAIEYKEKYKIPIMMNFWGWMPGRFTDPGWSKHYLEKCKLISKHVTYNSVPTKIVSEQMLYLGITTNTYLIPPGADTELAINVASRPFVAYNKYITSVGRLVPHKNFETVILALYGSDISYVIIGSGPEKARLEILAEQYKVRIEIVENANDREKFELLSHSIATIMPSQYEGFGMPVVESASVCTPVIANKLPSNMELFEDCIEYFESTGDLTAKINRLAKNPEYRKEKIKKISYLAIKYSGMYAANRLNQVLSQCVSVYLKDKLGVGHESGLVSTKEVYDCESQLDESYFNYRLNPENPTFSNRLNVLLGFAQGKKVLDCGVSTGVFSYHLARKGFEVEGVDISTGYIKLAQRLIDSRGLTDKVHFQEADFRNLPFEDQTFDTVWAGEILEHFENSDEVVKELTRVLKVEGRLIFTVPLADACYDPLHKQIFNTEDDIKKLFGVCSNLKVGEIGGCGNSIDRHNWGGYMEKTE